MHVCSDVVSERGCKYLDLGPGLKVGPDGRKLMGEICRSRDGYFQFSGQGIHGSSIFGAFICQELLIYDASLATHS